MALREGRSISVAPRWCQFIDLAVWVCLTSLVVVSLFASLIGWLVPVEVGQEWGLRRTDANDVFAQFEAMGQMQAIWLLMALGGPIAAALSVTGLSRRAQLSAVLQGSVREFLALIASTEPARTVVGRLQWTARLALVVALLTGGVHSIYGVWDRIRDWPYYQLRSGDDILPNISDSNREVIRYLKQATPDDARIFVASDQKLYFLSYYLWPRQVLHVMHPAAEHLIPQANQARQLAAYRLSEVPEETLASTRPDYVLEYFEGPEYVTPERNAEDLRWLRFSREWRQDSSYVPPYTVVLRPYEEPTAR